MDVLIIMTIGILLGKFIVPASCKKINDRMQVVCIVGLIFFLGVSLGQKEGFLEDLGSLGLTSIVFTILPMLFSILVVFVLTKIWLKEKDNRP